jgi:hypothetical protein
MHLHFEKGKYLPKLKSRWLVGSGQTEKTPHAWIL